IRDMQASDWKPGERPETMLCAFSFAHHPVAITLVLPEEFRASKATDVMGGSQFPAPDDQGHLVLTVPAQSFYWLSLSGVKQSVA
ncbi:MAG: maltose alpha-D-glucosyltransferase, partial [Actinomycetota bacterium]